MKDLTACCGLDCETCDAYLATLHNDDALREKTAKLWTVLNQTPISPADIHCQGCRTDGAKTVFCREICTIRSCVQQRGFPTCGACPDLQTCQTLTAVTSNQPQAMENLRASD